jgi:hypothetical protein
MHAVTTSVPSLATNNLFSSMFFSSKFAIQNIAFVMIRTSMSLPEYTAMLDFNRAVSASRKSTPEVKSNDDMHAKTRNSIDGFINNYYCCCCCYHYDYDYYDCRCYYHYDYYYYDCRCYYYYYYYNHSYLCS